ncbi:MAG: alpha/beta fold hydrolase [Sinimarinibacterium flocculans]|uniref:alpha/beta fold hydrolase n=1 Tax=Sinimarinibacterium flocculans TaxID=985250 RepID=UPI003C49EBFF
MIGARLDHWLYRGGAAGRTAGAGDAMRILPTLQGPVRALDSGGHGPVLLFAPDGPCVIEHYAALVAALRTDFRVVVFDLPGFGMSAPTAGYAHRLEQGADVILGVLDALCIARATLCFSCVNGFYAMAAAAKAPARVERLILAQTPGVAAMQAWTARMIPRPLRVPGLGQAINFFSRRKLARIWYRTALPKGADARPFDAPAQATLDHGGCFCLAGVVQGMAPTPVDHPLLQPRDVPVTLLWGGADFSHKYTDPDSLLPHLPQARILRFDAIGHFPDLEQPDTYAAVVREALHGTTS